MGWSTPFWQCQDLGCISTPNPPLRVRKCIDITILLIHGDCHGVSHGVGCGVRHGEGHAMRLFIGSVIRSDMFGHGDDNRVRHEVIHGVALRASHGVGLNIL